MLPNKLKSDGRTFNQRRLSDPTFNQTQVKQFKNVRSHWHGKEIC